jgi:hypothetical protein
VSEFDVHAAAFADDLIVHGGDEEAVELRLADGPQKFAARVGELRIESVVEINGSLEEESYRDTCRIMVHCPPDTIHLKTQLLVLPYLRPASEASLDSQVFYVRSIDGSSLTWTTVTVWRDSLAKRQRRGVEGVR